MALNRNLSTIFPFLPRSNPVGIAVKMHPTPWRTEFGNVHWG
jgi:hypothetical protein